jgi:hypothetical protein
MVVHHKDLDLCRNWHVQPSHFQDEMIAVGGLYLLR